MQHVVPGHPPELVLRELEENLWSFWSHFGRAPGCALRDEPEMLAFDTPIPILPYNGVLRFRAATWSDARIDGAIDEVFAHYRARKVPFWWLLHPTSAPADLGARLVKRGFADVELIQGMAANLDDLPPKPTLKPGIELLEVHSFSDVDVMLELVSWRWHVPEAAREQLTRMGEHFLFGSHPIGQGWVALKDGVPLAKVVTHTTSTSVGLYGVATKEEARGLGLARALSLTALHAARARGATLAVLHSTPIARNLYASIGFHDVAPLHLYTVPDTFQA
jgi:GNAT superfamily N-acetyltransferase